MAGFHIALVHLLFNIFGTAFIYGLPPLRRIPLAVAEWLADLALRSRPLAIGYILFLYFVFPLLLIGGMKLFADDVAEASDELPNAIETTATVEAEPSKTVEASPTPAAEPVAQPPATTPEE